MDTSDEKVIVIARYSNSRALLLKSRLEAEGIDCFLAHQNILQAAVSGGVEIKVRRSDVEKALRVIESSKEEHGKQKEDSVKSLRSVRKILVPVDFSDASFRACSFALGLAGKLKAEIKLLHVYYNPVLDIAPFDTSHAYQINLVNYLHESEQNARHQLVKLAKDLKQQVKGSNPDLKISTSLSNGLAAEEIALAANRFRPGLIILGTRGIGNQTGGFLGSVTAKVIEKTKTPVLAIPENSRFTSLEKIKHVMYATDFDQSDHLAISRLIGLLHPFNVSLHCVHISVGVKKSWDKVKMEGLSAFLTKEYKKYPVKCEIIVSNDVINGMETYIRDNGIDVIALTNHNRSLLSSFFTPSITKKVLNRISKPLFIFKAIE
ncbi:MAG: UspA domain-containing protein [Bacteroidetes bacterium]|nr:MAG: UspA domain-containing protein [Bacteroidota bacterium]